MSEPVTGYKPIEQTIPYSLVFVKELRAGWKLREFHGAGMNYLVKSRNKGN